MEVAKENNLPEGISCLVNGDYKVGELIDESDFEDFAKDVNKK